MFKALFLLGTSITSVSMPLALITGETRSQIIYDNHTFNSEEELFNYYLSQNPDLINTKMVIGDIDQAITDYDYGIIDQQKVYDYQSNNIFPAYVKNNGDLTASFAQAQQSFANPALLKEYYQGPTDQLYPSENEAKQALRDYIFNFEQGFYNLPNMTSDQGWRRYNPLNKDDYNLFKDQTLAALQSDQSNFKNNNYQKSIVQADSLPSLALNTDYAQFDRRNSSAAITKQKTIAFDSYNSGVLNPTDDMKMWFYNDSTKINGLKVNVYPLNIDFDTSSYWTIESEKFYVANGPNDSRHINHKVIANPTIKITENKDVDAIFSNSSYNTIDLGISTIPFDSNDTKQEYNHTSFNLSQLTTWTSFVAEAQAEIANFKATYNSDLDYELVINLQNPNSDWSNTGLFDFFFQDTSGSNDYLAIPKMDSSFLDIKFNIKTTFGPDYILNNITDHFLSYYHDIVNTKGLNWHKSVPELFDDFIANPYWINADGIVIKPTMSDYEKNQWTLMTNQIKNQNLAALENWQEIISAKSTNEQADSPIFEVKRNWNKNTNYGQVIDLPSALQLDYEQLKKALWANININNDLNNLKVNNLLFKDVFNDVLAWMFQVNSNEASIAPYITEIQAFAALSQVQANTIFGNINTANGQANILDILSNHLKSLQQYLHRFWQEKKIIDAQFILTDPVMKQAQIDLNCLMVVTPNNQLLDQNNNLLPNNILNSTRAGTTFGQYLLLNKRWYNSALSISSANNLDAFNQLFTDPVEFAKYKSVVIIDQPRVVRVLYDLDGNIIYGSLTANYVYDSATVILNNVANQAHVKVNPNYLFYQSDLDLKLVANHQVRIYTMTSQNGFGQIQSKYFTSYEKMKQYIIDDLLLKAIIT